MTDINAKLKNILCTSAKFVGKTADSAAKATKFKMNELTTLGKRRDLISDLGAKVYELSQNGLELPADAMILISQIQILDAELETMRADHAAQKAAAKAARAAEKAAAKGNNGTTDSTPLEVELPEAEMPDVVVVPTLDVEEAAEEESADDKNVPSLDI